MFVALTVVTVSWVCTYPQEFLKLYTLNTAFYMSYHFLMYNLLHINHTSISGIILEEMRLKC